ncbi:putative ribonuclease H-like domain-containing protein [Tanacetum coccineum]
MPDLENDSNVFPNDGIFSGAYDDEYVGAEADFNNMDNTINVSPIPTLRVYRDHPKGQILGDPKSAEEGINYDEVFAPVARIEAIRLFLAFASFMGFPVYQMDVKSAFRYGTIEEEVYVHQHPGFVDPTHPNKVYKVIKALYGLHHAPRAWYEILSSFLLKNGFTRGTIDKTLFIKKNKSDIMLVQVYVDDIIFGSTTQSMCTEFEDCMHKRFQMSSMGELTFFLGLQVKQQPDGIFISQDKYVADILKKFDFCSIKTATTPIESNKPLVKDEDGVDVDVHVYRSMIGSLMYLTASRPDIMFAVCACARFQVTPKASHLNAVKRIFRYLKHQPKLGLWYPRDSPFELEAFSDSDYGGASLDRKSTTGGCQFLGRRLISWQCKKQTIMANSTTEAEYVVAANYCGQKLCTAGTKVNTARLSLCCSKVLHDGNDVWIRQIWCCQANLMLPGKFGAVREIWCCQANLVLLGKISMANLEFVDQHNMVACLEKTEGNSNFHEIVDFLASSSIHQALTVSPPIYTSYIEQFWNTASSKIVNDVKQIDATIDSKAIVVIEASIRSSLLFNDADGTACLTNEAIFQNLALMGYEAQNLPAGMSFQRILLQFLMVFLNNQIELGEPFNDVYPTPAHNMKVFTNMSRKGLKFSGKITPLFPNMLAHVAEGEGSGEPTEPQPTPSPTQPSGHTSDRGEGALNLQELSILCTNLSNRVLALESIKDAQAAEISSLKSRIKKLEKKCKPSISHHKAWLKSVKRLSIKKIFGKREFVSKQRRKKSKPKSTLDDSTVFDDQDADHEVIEEKGSGDKGGNTEELVSTARPDIDDARQEDSVVEPRTPPATTSIFDDEDITMAQTLIKMKEEKAKEKGVSIKDVDDSSRPKRSILTLKPLPTIDPKYKGKGVLEEPEPAKKMTRSDFDAAQIARDTEIARQLQVDLQAEVERERQREEEASKAAIAEMYDEVQARIDAYALAAQRSAEIRSRPPTKSQLRNLIMTYLKNMGGYKHSQLKAKSFEEIKGMYERQKKSVQDFVPIGSAKEEELIKKMNDKATDEDTSNKEKVLEELGSTKVEFKQEGHEDSTRKRPGRRLKMKATKKSKRQKTYSNLEEEE